MQIEPVRTPSPLPLPSVARSMAATPAPLSRATRCALVLLVVCTGACLEPRVQRAPPSPLRATQSQAAITPETAPAPHVSESARVEAVDPPTPVGITTPNSAAPSAKPTGARPTSSPAPTGAVVAETPAARTSIFNGRTLAGWTETGGRYDGDAEWTVDGGAIVGRQGPNADGGLLYSAKNYGEFDFACDFQIDEPIDSGVFLRMGPDERGVQVTIDATGEGELGGIYSDGWLARNADGWRHFKKGTWNRLEISARGPDARAFLDLRAELNGEPLVAHLIPPNPIGFAPEGRIGLQVHGGQALAPESCVRFRNIVVREIESAEHESFLDAGKGALALSAHGYREGWRPLFDGRSLEGWELYGEAGGVRAIDGAIEIRSGNGGELRSLADYDDFELVLDFKTSDLANSGVFLRATRDDENPAYSGCEVQILDDMRWEQATKSVLEPWQFTGSLYGAVAPSTRDALRPTDEWNTYRIRYVGSRLAVELNGQKLYDVDTHALEVDPPFAGRAQKGFIGLQRHGAASEGRPSFVWFRNVFVRKLRPDAR